MNDYSNIFHLALSPLHFNHDEEDHHGHHNHHHSDYVQPTLPPPIRSTTLRTIIKPDSELYHSNSGIQVTFNTESKHQSGHEFQEHFEESALQPIVTDIRSPSIEGADRPLLPPPNFVRQTSHHQLTAGDRARAYEIQYANGPPSGQPITFPSNVHRFASQSQLSHLNSSPFLRPTPDQGLLLSYTQNQANRLYQSQHNFENRIKLGSVSSNASPNHRYSDQLPVLNVAPPLNGVPIKFRAQSPHHQPKPIPIPIHQHDKQALHLSAGLQLPQINHSPDFSPNYKPLRGKPQTHPNILYQQSYPQPIRSNIVNLSHPPLGKYV